MSDILFVAAYWAIYFFVHSLMASFWLKQKVEKAVPALSNSYRIVYNLISTIGLIYILLFLATTYSEFIFSKQEYWQLIGLILATWGLIVLKQSFKQYSIKEFLGLQSSGHQTGQEFTSDGILNYVRHPIYTGTILIVSGSFLFNPKVLMLVTLICVIIYIGIGIQLEERKLEKEFGVYYREYKKRVPMLCPKWPRRNSKAD